MMESIIVEVICWNGDEYLDLDVFKYDADLSSDEVLVSSPEDKKLVDMQ